MVVIRFVKWVKQPVASKAASDNRSLLPNTIDNMNSPTKPFVLLLIATLAVASIGIGCKDKSTAEKVEDNMKDAGKDVKKAAEKTGDAVKDAAKDATKQ